MCIYNTYYIILHYTIFEPGAREQVNQLSSYIDGTGIYGSTIELTKSLRTLSDGLMKTQVSSRISGLRLIVTDYDVNEI